MGGQITGFFLETENAIYSTVSELVKCHRGFLKPNSAFPKPEAFDSGYQANSHPCPAVASVIAQITDEELAPAHAINKGILHKICKHGLNKELTLLFEKPGKFTSGINARYKGQTVRGNIVVILRSIITLY
ncbi:hypothetical protein HW132_34830 [Brasilonema sp. CT11]|nr:hypothetical protein [Brasilonema sp. CT11]